MAIAIAADFLPPAAQRSQPTKEGASCWNNTSHDAASRADARAAA